MAKKSVLHVFNFFRPDYTGEGIYVTQLLPLLAERGIENHFLVKVTHPGGPSVRWEREPSEHVVHYLAARRSRWLGPEFQLCYWLLRHGARYDIVHFHAFCDRYFLSQFVARLYRLKIVQSCTLDDSAEGILRTYRPRWRGLVRRLYALVHAFVAISPKLHQESARLIRPERNLWIPQGVRIPEVPQPGRDAARRRLGLGPADQALLFVGALCARKDVHFLVECMLDLRHTHPRARLYVVGPTLEDDYAARVRRLVAEHGLEDRVTLTGFQEDPTPWYAAADVLVFSSRNEGFGNVLLEGMSHGLPLVVRRLPGVTDTFLEDDVTGHLFDNREGYLQRTRALLDDPDRRARLGQAARRHAIEHYALPAIADRYAALYETV